MEEDLKQTKEKLHLVEEIKDLEVEKTKELKAKLSDLEGIKKTGEQLMDENKCLSDQLADLQQELEGLREHIRLIENEKEHLMANLKQVFVLLLSRIKIVIHSVCIDYDQ